MDVGAIRYRGVRREVFGTSSASRAAWGDRKRQSAPRRSRQRPFDGCARRHSAKNSRKPRGFANDGLSLVNRRDRVAGNDGSPQLTRFACRVACCPRPKGLRDQAHLKFSSKPPRKTPSNPKGPLRSGCYLIMATVTPHAKRFSDYG